MRISENFVLNEIAGSWVLIPVGEVAMDFNGVVSVNATAKFLIENCDGEIDETALQNALIKNFEIDEATAKEAVEKFICELREAGCIDE